jgi:hypothetical protein
MNAVRASEVDLTEINGIKIVWRVFFRDGKIAVCIK